MSIDLGDVHPLTVQTRDAAGALADAGSVTLTISLPDGTSVGPTTITPASTGRYEYDYLTVMAGRHTARWLATGANASGYVDVFHVSPADNGALLSLAWAKEHLNISSTTHDEELRTWLGATTKVIERHTGLTIARVTNVEYHTACWASEIWLHRRPVLSLTSIVTLDGTTTWPVTSIDVHIHQEWGRLKLLRGSRWNGDLAVTDVVGMSVVPDNYIGAAKEILRRAWEPQQQPGLGPTPFGAESPPAVSDILIPRRALEMLGPPGVMVA